MSNIEVVKNVIVRGAMANINHSIINYPIYIEFKPDVMIVKGFSIDDLGSTDTSFILRSSLINGEDLISFTTHADSPVTFVPCDILFIMNKPVGGMYSFSSIDFDGNASDSNYHISIILEFIKYK